MPANDGVGTGSLLSRVANSEWIAPGLFFIALGCAALWISRDYPLGNLNRMGPGFFPRMLSFGMIGLGAMSVLRGLASLAAEPSTPVRFDRSMWLVPASMAVFGFAVEPLGLVVALALTMAVAGAAHRQAHLKEVALSTAFLIALSVLIFVVVLKLPLRLWPSL
jgi:putative tricarboxylic transport membrane protein